MNLGRATLRRSLILVVLLGLLLPTAIVSGVSWWQRYDEGIRQQANDALQLNAAVLASGMREPLWNVNRTSAESLLDAMMSHNRDIISIRVIDNTLGIFAERRYPERRLGPSLATTKTVHYRDRPIGAVQIEMGSESLHAAFASDLRHHVSELIAQALLSIILILMLLEKRLLVPLEKLGQGATRLARRELNTPFEYGVNDEIGLLARRLEDTRLSLRMLFEQIDRKNLELQEDIEQRKRTEKALQMSEAKFVGAFECNPDSITIVRVRDNVLVDVNQAFITLSGYSREEAVGKRVEDLHLWVDLGQRQTMMQRLRTERTLRDFECEFTNKAGDRSECILNATLFEVENEMYLLAVARNVGPQRAAERLKADVNRALLRLAQGSRETTGKSYFQLLVADLASALGVEAAYISLRNGNPDVLHIIASHFPGRFPEQVDVGDRSIPCDTVMREGCCIIASSLAERFPAIEALTDTRFASYAGVPLRDNAGAVIGVLGILHTQPLVNVELVRSLLQVFGERASFELERIRAEEALRASEQRFAALFQSSPMAMFVTHSTGDHPIKDVNRAFEKLFRRSRESVIGKNSLELGMYLNPSDRPAIIDDFARSEVSLRHELWMMRGDSSTMFVAITGHSLLLENERYLVVACEDITEKHRIEQQILELNAHLEQRVAERTEELQKANLELASALETLNMAHEELVRSEKLAALGSLVAGVAHELNTPIGNSLMIASTIGDQTRDFISQFTAGAGMKRSMLETYLSSTEKAGDILMRNLQRAANLVTSFKQVASDQASSQRRKFLLSEVVAEIVVTLWPSFKRTAFRVEHRVPQDLIMDSYPGPLGQVLANLLNNALLHAFEDRSSGHIAITAQAVDENSVEISFADDGIGIPAANLGRIFDPFFTTKLGAGGSGLGLNIVHNIVTGVLGGRIRVVSEPGQGTTFVITLPLTAPQKQPEDLPAAPL